jgi:site-specific DNA-methyltransferase (cytosine-N4-specific)
MTSLTPNYQDYYDFLAEQVVTPFYSKRLEYLQKMRLANVLKRKNPYLLKAKNIASPDELVRSIVDAFLSSQEETMFGNLLEEARERDEIFKRTYDGKINEMALEFGNNFLTRNAQIDWVKLVDYVSKRA